MNEIKKEIMKKNDTVEKIEKTVVKENSIKKISTEKTNFQKTERKFNKNPRS